MDSVYVTLIKLSILNTYSLFYACTVQPLVWGISEQQLSLCDATTEAFTP